MFRCVLSLFLYSFISFVLCLFFRSLFCVGIFLLLSICLRVYSVRCFVFLLVLACFGSLCAFVLTCVRFVFSVCSFPFDMSWRNVRSRGDMAPQHVLRPPSRLDWMRRMSCCVSLCFVFISLVFVCSFVCFPFLCDLTFGGCYFVLFLVSRKPVMFRCMKLRWRSGVLIKRCAFTEVFMFCFCSQQFF